MKVFDNEHVQLHQSNASELPVDDESIDCVVTSPPYWGLRDYGTGAWIGGDEGCDHQVGRFEYAVSKKQKSNSASAGHQAKDTCPKCGAQRVDEQIGLESTPEKYVENMVNVFREIKRVLKSSGTVWLNLGDSYVAINNKVAGYKSKDLVGIPWMVAFALRTDGWYLRSDIIWNKPNPMPESVKDRPTKSHEYIFLLTKSSTYYYDADAIREPHTYEESKPRPSVMVREAQKYRDKVYGGSGTGFQGHSGSLKADGTSLNHPLGRNKRSVWTINPHPYPDAHFATFPEKLVEPCILAGSPLGGTVLDPFVGSGTTLAVAQRLGRKGIGTDISSEYLELASKRLEKVALPMLLGI